MRASVTAAARAFQTTYEGRCAFMYVDREGLVTTGIGNKIDPVEDALRLPWQVDGRAASPAEIRGEWFLVKSRQDLRGADIHLRAAITRLYLAEESIDALFDSETARMWGLIVGGYPDAETWPAGAQLGSLSMSWAMGAGRILPGPAFQYPHFRAAALAQSWGIAAQECKMDGVGIDGRNAANKKLFLAAAKAGADPDSLPTL